MTVFWYQEEEYYLFLSEYDLLTDAQTESDTEEEQISIKIENYQLFLEKRCGNFLTQEAMKYSGGILIVKGLLEEYAEYEDMFSYETVLELIFKNGCLITTVDHSKAVLRIQRNLERGLRSLTSARDRICIQRFINRTVICDYRQSRYAYGKKKLFRNLYRGMEVIKGKVLKRQTE